VNKSALVTDTSLNILHVLRAPVGGLFRHVSDLARGQAALGHRVGVVADASTGGQHAEERLAQLAPELALGITRVAMSRHIGWRDGAACAHVARRAAAARADVVHGHGAKGGAYARLATFPGIRVYTPHGGSLHYDWSSLAGFFYLASERLLMRRTDLFLFESAYGRDVFEAKIGRAPALARVVHNGIAPEEFAPVAFSPDATDVLFVGELRKLKGVDVLIEALATLAREGRKVSATIVGEGPDGSAFEAQAATAGLSQFIRFVGAMPARNAFARGKLLVVPSRAESLPYIVLEGAAASIPMLATRVGGIAEIFGPDACALMPPGDPGALACALAQALGNPGAAASLAQRLRERVRASFSVEVMTRCLQPIARRSPGAAVNFA
jgi:glycosyltransferase involved in cell wall biosynthesis